MGRRLSAIFAADVVGYSRQMAVDEAATLARLKAHRSDLFDPMIARYNGRIVKLMGDGTLVEFASVVEAVECAIASNYSPPYFLTNHWVSESMAGWIVMSLTG